ncbi:MAG: hypothetical protein CVU48_00135 [Candidatus Cloacimonetes bacterium HGW-Cloacimonetes-1]|jgi:Tfp pilus assembly protein PilN|nr:MAG: hypothetical protein CVU48_00135 [Candidatus Cloacimonetes bacterium HGW-Cloacimonetes-1]
MKKHAKRAFGVFHDGLMVRMVELFREGTQVHLQAFDHTELDRYWYKIHDDPSVSVVDTKTKEDLAPIKSDMDLDDFDAGYVENYQLQSSDRMFAAFNLSQGVIAMNVYEENIARDSLGAVSKKDIAQFVKMKVGQKYIRSGEWQSSIVSIGGQDQHWVYSGTNRLFEVLKDYQRQNRMRLYYQLADANDIALTDYFKSVYAEELQGEALLVYLGQEYRKAFVFRDGVWTDTLKLQITQDIPEMDTICSKISLAIDSAQITEPGTIICCGDYVTPDLIEFMKTQFNAGRIEILRFSNVIISMEESESFEPSRLSQYTIAIALAYKALFPDDQNFTNSNFLPSTIMEAQKEFKIAWHGFLVMFLTFGVTMISTMAIMKSNQSYRQAKATKQELDFTLAQKRIEATEIQKIRTDLENQEKNIDILRTILAGKNPWTEILNTGNKTFAKNPTSWLLNLKQDKETFILAGVTTRRDNIVRFANEFTNSKIQKVVAFKVRNQTIWQFEISADLPKIDWIGSIQKDIEQLRALQQHFGEDTSTPEIKPKSELKHTKVKPASPSQTVTTAKTDKQGRVLLPPIQQANCPVPTDYLSSGDGEDVKDYRIFVTSINKGNIWEYRDKGVKFMNNHADSPLIPAVRWWLSYRLYLDKELQLGTQYLEPLLRTSDSYYPYALLLQARIDYLSGSRRYEEIYKQLRYEFGRHAIADQVNSDWSLITGEGAK